MIPLYLRLDSTVVVVATAPTNDGDWISVEEAARIVKDARKTDGPLVTLDEIPRPDAPVATPPGSGPHIAQVVQEIQEGARKDVAITPDPAPGSDAEHPPEGYRLATEADDCERMGYGWMDWDGKSWQPMIGNIGCVYFHCAVPVAIPIRATPAPGKDGMPLPCPCCGSTPAFGQGEEEGDGEYLECTNPQCRMTTPMRYSVKTNAKPLLVEIWNRRVPTDQRSAAAVRTLERMGHTWRGGQEWAPPLGNPPAYILKGLPNPLVKKLTQDNGFQPTDPAPTDQLKQLPKRCIPCCLNQDITKAARRIVDLEEERDNLQTRVEELITELQTAKDTLQEQMKEQRLTEEAGGAVERANQELDDALGRATLAERRAVQAEGRVRELTAHVGVLEDATRDTLEETMGHPLCMDLDATQEEIDREGGDAAFVTVIAQRCRDALSATDEGRA